MYGLAYDNVQQILLHDPKNKGTRKFIGHIYDKNNDVWQHYFYAQRMKKEGLKWSNDLGWHRFKELERYESGQHYDVQTKKWGDLENLNVKRSSIDDAWIIKTQHYTLHAGTDLETAISAAVELEGLYNAWIRSFVGFFPAKEARERLFDSKSFEPLLIYLWADKPMYDDWVRRHFDGDPLLLNSAGFYYTGNKASQLFVGYGWRSTMWHEVTHQIFGESSVSHSRNTNLVEGLAVYMEDGIVEDGKIVIDIARSDKINHFKDDYAAGNHSDLSQIWSLSREQFHGSNRYKNYSQAGLAMFFFMTYDNGRYKNDIVAYASDDYNGRRKFSLADYCGTTQEALDAEFREWVAETMK